jgi:hypothetical protein
MIRTEGLKLSFADRAEIRRTFSEFIRDISLLAEKFQCGAEQDFYEEMLVNWVTTFSLAYRADSIPHLEQIKEILETKYSRRVKP